MRGVSVEPDLRPCGHCGYFTVASPCPKCGDRVLDGPLGAPILPGRRMAPVELTRGFVGFYRAAIHLLTRPEYFGRLAAPVAASAAATIAIAALAYWGFYAAAEWLAAQPWGFLQILRGPVSWSDDTFAVVLTVVTTSLVGPVILQTLTIPFLDPLADSVEKMLGGPGLSRVPRTGWGHILTNVRASSQVLAMQLVALVPCLLLSFCHIGLVAALVIASFLNALLWFEVPFARRGYTTDQRIRLVRHNRARTLGFGLAFQLGMFVPFFNILLLAPTAAVAATMSYFWFEKIPRGGVVLPPPDALERRT